VADVTIRRCVMRVVRRGGWSWGREPRALVADVVRALPALLAAELQRLLPDDADGEIIAPLRVDVRIGLSELRAWAHTAATLDGSSAEVAGVPQGPPTSSPSHGEAIAQAVRRALAAARPAERVTVSTPSNALPQIADHRPDPHRRAAAVLELLVAWQSSGALDGLLGELSDAVVDAWHDVLLHERRALVDAELQNEDTIDPDAEHLLVPLADRAREAIASDRKRLRLLAAAELATTAGAHPTRPEVRAAIDRAIPLAADAESSSRAIVPTARGEKYRADTGYVTQVSSALPFLLLNPLHRIGWIELLEATLAGAHMEDQWPALATGLATKVLPEPERGWRRTVDAVRSASTFAGDAAPRPDAEIADLARTCAPLTAGLEAIVRRALLDGRRRGEAVLLSAVETGWLIVDPPGVFLLSHASHEEMLAARLVEASSPVFIPERYADARLLATLDANGVIFVTPARPVREERWIPVADTRAPRLFSNRPLVRMVMPGDQVVTRARDTWSALARRPLPGRPSDRQLDHALSLAAALALGTIAWDLWRRREATDPLLALERFGDLEGTVRFEEHQVRVRLPLGKRFRDLKDAGFLEDVPRVPWLGYRSVVFAGG
jgi:hypothetical protein